MIVKTNLGDKINCWRYLMACLNFLSLQNLEMHIELLN